MENKGVKTIAVFVHCADAQLSARKWAEMDIKHRYVVMPMRIDNRTRYAVNKSVISVVNDNKVSEL